MRAKALLTKRANMDLTMNNYSTKHPKSTTENKPVAGDIQAEIDLRLLARVHLGQPLFSSPTADTHIDPFFLNGGVLHITQTHYRDPENYDNRGGAIKFIQKFRRCSYGHALSYLEGWRDRQLHRLTQQL